jgi:hypothetical protein
MARLIYYRFETTTPNPGYPAIVYIREDKIRYIEGVGDMPNLDSYLDVGGIYPFRPRPYRDLITGVYYSITKVDIPGSEPGSVTYPPFAMVAPAAGGFRPRRKIRSSRKTRKIKKARYLKK